MILFILKMGNYKHCVLFHVHKFSLNVGPTSMNLLTYYFNTIIFYNKYFRRHFPSNATFNGKPVVTAAYQQVSCLKNSR